MDANNVLGERTLVNELRVATSLKQFVDEEVLADTDVEPSRFWSGFADLVHELSPRNRALLVARASMQKAINAWHRARAGQVYDLLEYKTFLGGLGYLLDEGEDFLIDTDGVDEEIAHIPGPQLVVPVTNARYAINAANARWGSLYDALYGTDALGAPSPQGGYDVQRGAQVIAWGRNFLDEAFPLVEGSHADAISYRVVGGCLRIDLPGGRATVLADTGRFVGHRGTADRPSGLLLRNHGLGVEILIDRQHPIGRTDMAGVADLVLEAAVSVIMDCEDSVTAVDAEDKIAAYRNWLGLMRGSISAEVTKDGRTFTRRLAQDRTYIDPAGRELVVHGRALMLIRNVGHLMVTDAILDRNGEPIPEGFLDAMVSVACALHDLNGRGELRNSRTGSVYVVKPKMHGPEEVAFADELFNQVEQTLGIPANTVKIGIMDEERRTSANLKECVRAVRSRIAFINTGFLDRTGDEIHTSMESGAMIRKAEMKNQPWIRAYEDGNVDVGLSCGLPGRAQIGKGMWAAPDLMHAMLEEKISHPEAGANCAWVPSPTAATLHAIHYHRVDVFARQRELAQRARASLSDLLTIPVADLMEWTEVERLAELENNAQGILGYVVRWIDQGIGVSKVPDINDVALMEDRATCRISSQHMANWLRHGVTTQQEVMNVMQRMAVVVDEQNAYDPAYTPMAPKFDGLAFSAAIELVLNGHDQPSGYTEPILHAGRDERKRLAREGMQ